ncbi:TlyA family RNA methyltransferase [Propionibacteriaceae bacterium Y2011]|uniref:TlyA family RNA methyltransferase n=1 Tax=Microlunatus sp. Y2014 TaxID=3418488 RepID=UPI003B44C301
MSRRLDRELVARGLATSRTRAAALITAGVVTVAGRPVTRPAAPVSGADEVVVTQPDPYVSRAAHKLLGALTELGLSPYGRALDAGASTGGFSQVLLEAGVRHVYAVDVGHGQLHPTIRDDPRVSVHERLHLRELTLAHVEGDPVDWLVADVSFISLTLLLEPMLAVLRPDGHALVMVKPQFEVGRDRLGPGGVVRDEGLRAEAVDAVVAEAVRLGWDCTARARSVLPGESGNAEEFIHLRCRTA